LDIKLPAMVDAAQPALLIAAIPERDPPMRAELLQQTDAAIAIAEGDEVLAQQLDPHRRAVGLGQLARQQRRQPVPPQEFAGRRPRADSRDQLVLLNWKHDSPSTSSVFSTVSDGL